MKFSMLTMQPRRVVVGLLGMSEVEEHEVLKDLPPVGLQADGTPLYAVGQCRRKLEEFRSEPVATLKSIRDEIQTGQTKQRDALRETIEMLEREMAKFKEVSNDLKGRVSAATKAISNSIDEPPYLTTQDVARDMGVSVATVRKLNREGLFPKSQLGSSKGNGKHAKFDPNRVWDDIAEIRKKRPWT